MVEERMAAAEERKAALEEKKVAMEEHQRLVEEEKKLFFMDMSKLDEKQKEYINLCRDEVLTKKRMMTNYMKGANGGMSVPMGGYGTMNAMGGMSAPPGGYGGMGAMGAPPGGFMASMVSPIPPTSEDGYGDSTVHVNTVQVSNGEEAQNGDANEEYDDVDA
jgi:hypothetical protein